MTSPTPSIEARIEKEVTDILINLNTVNDARAELTKAFNRIATSIRDSEQQRIREEVMGEINRDMFFELGLDDPECEHGHPTECPNEVCIKRIKRNLYASLSPSSSSNTAPHTVKGNEQQ